MRRWVMSVGRKLAYFAVMVHLAGKPDPLAKPRTVAAATTLSCDPWDYCLQ